MHKKELIATIISLITCLHCLGQTNYTELVDKEHFEMIYVEGGVFKMGCTHDNKEVCSDDEFPVFSVSLPDYYIGKFPVTHALYEAVMGESIGQVKGCPECPIESVNWYDALEFIEKLNELTGKKYRLPTEAEWEYAARGGVKSKGYIYAGGNDINLVGWYNEHKLTRIEPVGLKNPNELGIYDMSGGVWEWCQDSYTEYDNRRKRNPLGVKKGRFKVLRGGSWTVTEENCRVSARHRYFPHTRTYDFGFRIAHDTPIK
jgi:formylglycine-generating enzyme required for sulfatase activity